MSTWELDAWDEVGLDLPLPSIGPSTEPPRVSERRIRRATLRDAGQEPEVEAYPGQAIEVEAAREEADRALNDPS